MAVGRVDGASGLSSYTMLPLEDRFEVIKEIGDGSFGSVALARVRGAGSNVARRGTMIAIKTMKKTYESLSPCLELREVIFLRTLPAHPHLIPALDIFLDPLSKKLHICMEYMDGNLYQLMKARDHKCMDGRSVKSILFQIISGLDHIHGHDFFHRDIKPENILVSTSAPQDSLSAFSRYSAFVTPPPTPPTYSIKIADFGLAREAHSDLPYTTYVSTRWYRAPEVLLRAGEYSAPVDMWAIGAMAVEIATLKPLFPGGNEVDQVWRVCEIMGSPGNWYSKSGARVGGGDWRQGTRLAQKLGFSFPKMAPHSMETILTQPQWPASFSNFVTWCLMWDPRNRPTSRQSLEHEYFADALDPMRPKSSTSRLLGRKQSDLNYKPTKETCDPSAVSTKPSWFRRSLIIRDNAPSISFAESQVSPAHPSPAPDFESTNTPSRLVANERSTWVDGSAPSVGAPMPILPSIRPISPLSNAVTAQAGSRLPFNRDIRPAAGQPGVDEKAQKIGRQLSVNSRGNHYTDSSVERESLDGCGPLSPRSAHKQSFFSHLRKRARRFSGRHGATPPNTDDVEAGTAEGIRFNRSSMLVEKSAGEPTLNNDLTDLDRALRSVRYSLEYPTSDSRLQSILPPHTTTLQRHQSLPQVNATQIMEANNASAPPVSRRAHRAMQMTSHSVHRYETPEEEDELLDEVLNTASAVAARLAHYSPAEDQSPRPVLVPKDMNRQSMPLMPMPSDSSLPPAYPTPSPSAKCNSVLFGKASPTSNPHLAVGKSLPDIARVDSRWPTPPYEENEWGAGATASICAAGMVYR